MQLSKKKITAENGKAYLEFTFSWEKSTRKEDVLWVRVWDEQHREQLLCEHPLGVAQPVKGLLLHPHLWNSTQDPYCYRLQAELRRVQDGVCRVLESMEELLPIYTLEEKGVRGWYLNDHPFCCRRVSYQPQERIEEAVKEEVKQDINRICHMGATVLCVDSLQENRVLCDYALQKGLLVWKKQEGEELQLSLPEEWDTDKYYQCKAQWSREPFVYLSPGSLQLEEDGTCSFTVYSNQKRVALYCDGVLFEFQSQPPEFLFEQVPVTAPMLLTLEAGECVRNFSFHTFFTG